MQENHSCPAENTINHTPCPQEGQLDGNIYQQQQNIEVYEKMLLESENGQPEESPRQVYDQKKENFKEDKLTNEQKDTEIKILEEGYNPEPENQQYLGPLEPQTIEAIKEEKASQYLKHYEQIEHQPQISHQQIDTLQHNSTQPASNLPLQSTPQHYNSYMQAVLNSPINPATQPSHQALEGIYNEFKILFPECLPEQIILLLYNNLIKTPREELRAKETHQFDNDVKYDGGHKYWNQISHNSLEMGNFEIRKEMIKVYVTKGYGLKVFQEYMKQTNPSAPEIDKEKFKKHFIEIYKIIMKKVQEFLTTSADRQFEPLRRDEYQKPLSDVINCKKHYPPEFCEVFYRILQATFDKNFDKVPNEEEVISFYTSIMEKLRGGSLAMVKKLHQHPQEEDPDVWTGQFEQTFIMEYIKKKTISQARTQLLKMYPECEVFVTPQKLVRKIENAIRVATNWLAVENTNCGNPVMFSPSDIDRKFIMTAPQLQESRIKLLKVYLKRPKDKKVLANIVEFIHFQLKNKYEIEKIPEEVIVKSTHRQVPRAVEKSGLETLLKNQVRKYD